MSALATIGPDVLLAAGYSIFLLAVALGLERLARHSHRRALRFNTAGFTYHPVRDLWECPAGQQLLPSETDRERGLVRYRAPARACNACPLKPGCTDSDEGREVVRSLTPWLQSETGRFHRGLSLVLVLLAGLIVGTTMVRSQAGAELLVLGGVFGAIGAVGLRLAMALRA